MVCKMLCFGHVAAYFLSKRFYILDTCIIFHQIMFLKELSAFVALYFLQGALFIHGAFILFRALLFFLYSAFQFLHSAFLFLHSALFRFLCESALVYFLQLWVSCAIFTFLPNCHAAIISISWCEALISWLVSEIFDDCVYQYQC